MAGGVGLPGTTPGLPHSETGESGLRTRLRHLARVLHDDIGPSLCAAGLHLELLNRELAAPAQTEPAAALREALEHAVESVRRLSYEAAPDLARRHGLDGACRLLAASRPWMAVSGEAPAGLPSEPAQALYEFLLDLLLATGACPAAYLSFDGDPGWSLLLPALPADPESWFRRAAGQGLSCSIESRGAKGVRISAAWMGGAGKEEQGCLTY